VFLSPPPPPGSAIHSAKKQVDRLHIISIKNMCVPNEYEKKWLSILALYFKNNKIAK
jgi:hypothetical protein